MSRAAADAAPAPYTGVSELETMELAVRYHAWTFSVVRPFIGRRVLEVGGGLGSLSRSLLDRERLVILDYDAVCAARLTESFAATPNVRVLQGDIADPRSVEPLGGERLDTAICVNVLEHVEDDRAALANMRRALSPGGRLVLLVPAHPSLYGTLDKLVGHHRRYTRAEALEKVRGAGFTIERSRYFNSVGALGRFLIGRVARQQSTGKGQVLFYDRFVVPVLRPLERVIPPPFGQSLIVIGAAE